MKIVDSINVLLTVKFPMALSIQTTTLTNKRISLLVKNKADITLISESNIEILDDEEMAARASKFPDFKCKDKRIDSQLKARLTMMVRNDIKYKNNYWMNSSYCNIQ